MKYTDRLDGNPKVVDSLYIFIGDIKYSLMENEGKLNINKISYSGRDNMLVFPIVSNVIEIT